MIRGSNHRLRRLVAAMAAAVAVGGVVISPPTPAAHAATTPIDQRLAQYNETWTSKSTGVTGSMPIGNGIQAANVWVEGNTLKLLLSSGDSWDENVRLAKLGRLDVTFSPDPFSSGSFLQVLKLKEGEVVVTSGSAPAITTRIWADANHPTIHIESNAPSAFSMQADFVNARPVEVTDPSRSNTTFVDLVDSASPNLSPFPPKITADTVYTRSNKLLWNHHNPDSRFDEIMQLQGLDPAGYDDPLTGRTFGGLIQGTGFTTASNTRLVSDSSASKRLDITMSSQIDKGTDWLNHWETGISATADTVATTPASTLRAAHQQYWTDFWNRSYIFASGDADAAKVTKGWLHTRYTEAIAGRTPKMPLRFNGSLFSPGTATDPDYRPWNTYHGFNQRFAYWSMLPSGDYDLMQPYFDQYVSSLGLAKDRVQAFWGNGATEDNNVQLPPAQGGAMWPETVGLWGHAVGGSYGWNRAGKPANWYSSAWVRYLYENNVGLTSMMLDYFTYTGDSTFATQKLLPVAREVVRFYDTHWNLSNGKIDMYPMNSGEADRLVHNPMADTAGLTNTVNGLLALPTALTTQADRDYWTAVKGRLPNLPIGSSATDNDTSYGPNDRLKSAASLFKGSDTNNQNLSAIFPLGMFGNGQPNLDLAVASYNDRRGKYPTNGTQDWRQDAAWAAYLGLTDEARYQTVQAFRAGTWRYTGFGPGSTDGQPGNEPRSIGKIALQAMLLHPGAGDDAILFNAWPSNWDVTFKLHTTNGRIVEGSLVSGIADYTVSAGAGTITVRPPQVTSYSWTAQSGATPLGGDVNGDGKGDLLAWQSTDGSVLPKVGNGSGTQFTQLPPTVWATTGTSTVRFGGDFNGDGKLDLGTWSNNPSGSWKIRYGTGTTFGGESSFTWTAQPGASLVTGDFNGDGRTDLGIWQTNGYLYIRYSNGSGSFGNQTREPLPHPGTGAEITAGDFDGDGDGDLAYWSGADWSVRVGDGAGHFGEPTAIQGPPGNGEAVTSDINGDGTDDLVVWTPSAGTWVTRYDLL
ncbi:DUF5703 domain-containing protein [Kitasatospora sp. NPDC058406]|uniref:DUF5703 domain-containing protein n=1 Tax=Kitasatospora sp. NPDC058406 TaxID=3346483 RepID=UPI00365A5618